MWYMQYVICSFENTQSTYVQAYPIHILVTCVEKVSVMEVCWKSTTVYFLESVYTYVKCAIVRLLWMLWIIINVSILESVLLLVMWVVNHSLKRARLLDIRLFILESVLLPMCITKHSNWRNILRITFFCTVQSKSLILKSVDLWVVCVTSDLVAGISKYRWQLTEYMWYM